MEVVAGDEFVDEAGVLIAAEEFRDAVDVVEFLVDGDFVVGDDGLARAVRFVQ